MSYILEALKKAQAERQLGETPGIHAPVPEAPASTGAPLRKPFVAVVAAMAAVIAGLAVVVWRQAATPVQAVPVAQVRAPAVAPAVVPAVAPEAGIPAPAPAMPAAAQPAPGVLNRSAPEPAAQAVKERPSVPAVQSVQQTPPAPAPVVHDKAPPMAAAAPKSDEAPREEAVQALRDLPEPIRRAIPPVAMSGYMYSPNPADRLVLIDKVLRREGDEVAPGLVLERLEPKGAVFAFRGYRYRIPY